MVPLVTGYCSSRMGRFFAHFAKKNRASGRKIDANFAKKSSQSWRKNRANFAAKSGQSSRETRANLAEKSGPGGRRTAPTGPSSHTRAVMARREPLRAPYGATGVRFPV